MDLCEHAKIQHLPSVIVYTVYLATGYELLLANSPSLHKD